MLKLLGQKQLIGDPETGTKLEAALGRGGGTGSWGTAAENWFQRGSRGGSIMARRQGGGQRPREGWDMLSSSVVQQRPEQDSC